MIKIVCNKAKCKCCQSVIESTNRHHLCFCSCGAIYVDGGKDYLRRGGHLENIEELSEYLDDGNDDTDEGELC